MEGVEVGLGPEGVEEEVDAVDTVKLPGLVLRHVEGVQGLRGDDRQSRAWRVRKAQLEVVLIFCAFQPVTDEILLPVPFPPSTFSLEDALRVLFFLLKVQQEQEQESLPFLIYELWKEEL